MQCKGNGKRQISNPKGEAERTELTSEKGVMAVVKELCDEVEGA